MGRPHDPRRGAPRSRAAGVADDREESYDREGRTSECGQRAVSSAMSLERSTIGETGDRNTHRTTVPSAGVTSALRGQFDQRWSRDAKRAALSSGIWPEDSAIPREIRIISGIAPLSHREVTPRSRPHDKRRNARGSPAPACYRPELTPACRPSGRRSRRRRHVRAR